MQPTSPIAEPRRSSLDEFIRANTTQKPSPVAAPSTFARFMAELKVVA